MSAPYNPNKHGWGFALVVSAMTAGLFFMAYSIHTSTYRHPRDPMAAQVYADRDAKKGDHGADEKHGEKGAESHESAEH
jgi:hypothetical protein